MGGFEGYLAGIAADLVTAWKVRKNRVAEVRAVIGHALLFSTWLSLEAEGVADHRKAKLLL